MNLVVAEASSTAEVLADVFAELGVSLTPEIAEALYAGLVTDTGRFQYANTTPKALRLAAELLEAGADIQRIFQGVYESMQFAKVKLLARALDRATLYEEGRVVVSYLLREDFGEVGAAEPYSEGIIDVLRAVEGAELAALSASRPATAARRGRSRCVPRTIGSTCRRSRAGRAAAAIARRPDSRATSRSTRSPTSSCPRSPPSRPRPPERQRRRDGDSEGARADRVILVDKPAGPSSFAVSPAFAPARERRPGTRNARSRSQRGSCFCCPVGQLQWRHASSGCQNATSRTSTSRGGRPPATPRATARASRAASAGALEAALAGLRGDVELPIPAASAVKIGGERAYRLHRKGIAVEMPVRRRRSTRSTSSRIQRASPRSTCVSAPARTSGRSPMRSAATASPCGERKSGRSPSAEADPERIVPLDEALARIGLMLGEAEAELRRRRREPMPGKPGAKCAKRSRWRAAGDRGQRGTGKGGDGREDRPLPVAARAPAAGGRDRDDRRSPPRAPAACSRRRATPGLAPRWSPSTRTRGSRSETRSS